MRHYLKYIVVIAIYGIFVYLSVLATPPVDALSNDAQAFVDAAKSPFTANQFIDLGYPVVLSLIIKILGTSNLYYMQIANYIFWMISTYLVYLSLITVGSKYAKQIGLLMLFSPLFLTFSAKIYSEPLAALGISLLLFGHLRASKLSLAIGSVIAITTKSLFFPGIILLLLYYLYKKMYKLALPIAIVLILLIPYILSSLGGGRSLYNLAIERAKLDHSYDQIIACAPYYLSYPLGQKVLPSYEGICRQNDFTTDLPGSELNPYKVAYKIREEGFTYTDWINSVISNPIKYSLVFIVGLFNLILFEGIYPSILLQLPGYLVVLCYVVLKLILNLYLWIKVCVAGKNNYLILLPIFYLVLSVGHFQVEPRYIYPLVPYIYFLVGIPYKPTSTHKSDSHQ